MKTPKDHVSNYRTRFRGKKGRKSETVASEDVPSMMVTDGGKEQVNESDNYKPESIKEDPNHVVAKRNVRKGKNARNKTKKGFQKHIENVAKIDNAKLDDDGVEKLVEDLIGTVDKKTMNDVALVKPVDKFMGEENENLGKSNEQNAVKEANQEGKSFIGKNNEEIYDNVAGLSVMEKRIGTVENYDNVAGLSTHVEKSIDAHVEEHVMYSTEKNSNEDVLDVSIDENCDKPGVCAIVNVGKKCYSK